MGQARFRSWNKDQSRRNTSCAVESRPPGLPTQSSLELSPMIAHDLPHRKMVAWVALGLAGLAGTSAPAVFAQVSPQESARRLTAGPGLEATLWASEPMLANPTNIDIDSRGRVWVTEGLNYRLSRGQSAVSSHRGGRPDQDP